MAQRHPVDAPLRPGPVLAGAASSSPFEGLTRIGEILILQLLFLVASLPVVTGLPAALALQRSLHDTAVQNSGRPLACFARNLRWSLPRFWTPGVVLALGSITGVVALGFWSSLPGIAGWLGVGVIGGMALAAAAAYLALLAAVTSPQLTRNADRLAVIDVALDVLRRRALRVGIATVLIACWVAVLLQLPTLALVGSGLVPAGTAWTILARSETPTARAETVRAGGGAR